MLFDDVGFFIEKETWSYSIYGILQTSLAFNSAYECMLK